MEGPARGAGGEPGRGAGGGPGRGVGGEPGRGSGRGTIESSARCWCTSGPVGGTNGGCFSRPTDASNPHQLPAGPEFVIPGKGRGRGDAGRGPPQMGRGGIWDQKLWVQDQETSGNQRIPPQARPPMDDQPPEADLSHLTEEERVHILAVLNRAKGLQEKDEERGQVIFSYISYKTTYSHLQSNVD